MELNNKLIEESYMMSKKREYVQLHMEESDLGVLDLDHNKNKQNENNPNTIGSLLGGLNNNNNTASGKNLGVNRRSSNF